MGRKRKPKLDISKNRQLELREIIDREKEIYNINSLRVKKLKKRRDNEIEILDSKFIDKLTFGLNIKEEKSFWRKKRPTLVDTSDRICEIDITFNNRDKLVVKIQYNNNYDDVDVEINRVRAFCTICERASALRESHLTFRKHIYDNYQTLIDKIDITDCYIKYQDAEKEMNQIQDHLKFEPGKKYIFDSDYVSLKIGRGRYDTTYINSLEIIKTTPAFTFFITQNRNGVKNEYRMKKNVVLTLLKKNSWHYEKHVERANKIERLLAETE